MQLITYSVATVTTTGRVIQQSEVIYTDAATEKSIKVDLAREHNVSPDAVLLMERSRKSV